MRLFTRLSLLPSLAVILVSAEHHGSKRNHAAVAAKREEMEPSVFKRSPGAQFTFYQDGLGACGKWNKPSDFIVALNTQQFAGGAHCFETITITVGGKSAQAQIVDECMGCGFNNLDFSQGLFDYFGSESVGVLHGSWGFGGGSPPPSPSPSPSPSPKAQPSPSPSPQTTSSSSSSSSKPPPSSTKYIPSSSSTSSTTSTTSTSTPTPTSSSVPPNVDIQTAGAFASQAANSSNLYALNMAFMGLSNLIASA